MSTIDKLSTVSDLQNKISNIKDAKNSNDFSKILKESIDETNQIQKNSQRAMSDLATGEVKDLHQAAIAINKAETSMKLMLEVRNKALNAYKEILRTQI